MSALAALEWRMRRPWTAAQTGQALVAAAALTALSACGGAEQKDTPPATTAAAPAAETEAPPPPDGSPAPEAPAPAPAEPKPAEAAAPPKEATPTAAAPAEPGQAGEAAPAGPPPFVRQRTSPAEMTLQEGQQLAEQRNYFDARQRFQAATQTDPQSATAWYNLGLVQWRSGSPDEAIASLRKAVSINPTYSRAVYLLALVQIRAGRADDALQSIEEALKTRSRDVMLRAAKAEALLARKRALEAQQVIIDAIRLDYDNPELLRLLGASYLALGREGLATAALEKAYSFYVDEAKVEEGEPPLLSSVKTNYDRRLQRGSDGQRGTYAEALSKDDGLAHIYYLYGQMDLRKEKYEAARKNFQKAVEYRADYPEAWNNLGVTWLAAKRDQDAIDTITRALELDPEMFEARINLGNAFRISKLSDRALKAKAEYERAMKMDPRHPAPHFNMGVLYLENKELMEDSKARLNKAIEYFNVYRNLTGRVEANDTANDYIEECKNLIKIADDQVKAEEEAKKYKAEEEKRLLEEKRLQEEEERKKKEEEEKNKPAEGQPATPPAEGGQPAPPADTQPTPPPADTQPAPPPAGDAEPAPPPADGGEAPRPPSADRRAPPAPPPPAEEKKDEPPPAPPANGEAPPPPPDGRG